jgi:hypothetical protein
MPTAVVPVTPEGADVLHAMDERVPHRVALLLDSYRQSPRAFVVPSLKHISRNPRKLFAVVDFVLAYGGEVVTANLQLTPGTAERRDELVSYNDRDFTWAGIGAFEAERVGRNDPCPCGSGLKYKRCCGR